jgi:muramidase (phage lysozyme)
MPQRYEPSASYKGFAQSHGFQPIRPADVTPLLRQNRETEQQNLQRALDQTRRVRDINRDSSDRQLQRELEADKYNRDMAMDARKRRFEALESNRQLEAVFSDQQMEDLMAFSKTITESVTGLVEWNEGRIREEVLSEAFQQGLSPEQTTYFDTKETAVDGATVMARSNAAILEANGAPTDLVQKMRNATGSRKKYMTEAIMLMAGESYGSFRLSASDKISVRIGDKDVTLANAANTSEWAAVNKKIRDEYLARFSGANAAMANKYLFPKLYETERKESAKFAVQMKSNLLSERKIDFKRSIHSKVIGGASIKDIQKELFLAAADFGGLGGSRKELFTVLKDTLGSGLWKPEHVAHLEDLLFKQVAEFNDGSKDTFANKFSYDMAANGIAKALQTAKNGPINMALEERKTKANTWNLMFQEDVVGSDIRATDAQLEQLIQDAKDDGIYDLVKHHIDDYVTVEEQDVEEAKDLAESLIADKGYITGIEAKGLPTSVRAFYRQQGKILDKAEELFNDDYRKRRDEEVAAMGWKLFNRNGLDPRGPAYTDWKRSAERQYDTLYQRAFSSGEFEGPEGYHSDTLPKWRQQTDDKEFRLEPPKPNAERGKLFRQTAQALKEYNHDINVKLPGLQLAVDEFAEHSATGKGNVPSIFRDLARILPGKSAWDVAAAQAAQYGVKVGPKPKVEQQLDQMHPGIQRLMRLHPTATRVKRARQMASSGIQYQEASPEARALLRLISWAEGTDDQVMPYNVMFTFRTFQGFDKHPRQLNYAGDLGSDAAGRYQMLSTTWDEAKGALGLNDFSEASQDRAAIYLLNKRGWNPNIELTEANLSLLAKIAPEWASFPVDEAGNGYYPGQNTKGGFSAYLAKYREYLKMEREAAKELNTPGSLLPGLTQ